MVSGGRARPLERAGGDRPIAFGGRRPRRRDEIAQLVEIVDREPIAGARHRRILAVPGGRPLVDVTIAMWCAIVDLIVLAPGGSTDRIAATRRAGGGADVTPGPPHPTPARRPPPPP